MQEFEVYLSKRQLEDMINHEWNVDVWPLTERAKDVLSKTGEESKFIKAKLVIEEEARK